MANYIIFLTTMDGKKKGKSTPSVLISGVGIKDTIINAIRQFNTYNSWDTTKQMIKAGLVYKTAKDEFALRGSYKSTTDTYWILSVNKTWLIRKYHKPNPKSSVYIEKVGYYEDVYTIEKSKVNHPYAVDFMTAVKENKTGISRNQYGTRM